jgi:hypothetical protein
VDGGNRPNEAMRSFAEHSGIGPSQVLFFKINSSQKLEITILEPGKSLNLSELLQ